MILDATRNSDGFVRCPPNDYHFRNASVLVLASHTHALPVRCPLSIVTRNPLCQVSFGHTQDAGKGLPENSHRLRLDCQLEL
jgi:hypothetical protein